MEKPSKQSNDKEETKKKKKRFDHAGCPSYPFCSDDPRGCLNRTKAEDVEWSCRVRKLTHFKINTESSVTYTKLKPLHEAPYCADWVRRAEVLNELLGCPDENHRS